MLTQWARYEGVTLEAKKVEAKVGFGLYLLFPEIMAKGAPPWPGRIVDLADVYEGYLRGSFVYVRSEASLTKAEEAEFMTWVESRMMDAQIPMEDI